MKKKKPVLKQKGKKHSRTKSKTKAIKERKVVKKKAKKVVKRKKRLTKCLQVEKYLRSGRRLTSWQAINFFGATRLADIIFRFRNRRKNPMNISTELKDGEDRYGNVSTYAVYKWIKPKRKTKKSKS